MLSFRAPFVLCLSLLAGCGSQEIYPVTGKVVYKDGQPAAELAGCTITFEAVDKPMSASAVVEAGGTFTVGTNGTNDGALLGRHRVAIAAPEPPLDAPPPKPVIDRKYANFETSGLTIEVKPEVNAVTLEVERAK